MNKKIFNKNKFKEVVLYLIANSENENIKGKKKLAKLLYFADFNFFEAYEKFLTGATYRKLRMGPFPIELDNILKEMNKREINMKKENVGLENDLMIFSLKIDSNNIKFNLTENEKKVLDKIISDYSRLSGKVLEDITHSEAPFNSVSSNEKIPYELSFYRGKNIEELVGK
jgi:uncharacterized phage-associated protein